MSSTIVLGTGQLGAALVRLAGAEVRSLDRAALDLADLDAIEPALASERPAVLINAAAYNRVDEAERRPAEAFAVNAVAPGRLARAATSLGARFVHISTDYVFSGDVRRPYLEDDLPAPLGVYGASKLAGEHLVRAHAPDALIVRTGGVFGTPAGARRGRHNFVQAILAQARASQPLRVVDDQTVGPTYALDLACAILRLVDAGATGTVHVASAGCCTWYEFARAILDAAGLDIPVIPISSAERAAAARRPPYSVLDCTRLAAHGIVMPHWRDALKRYLAEVDP
jgi:dTDP-4-dehydrorhamnose reductase